MKRVLVGVAQVVPMLVVGVAAMLWHPSKTSFMLWQSATERRTFEPDWLAAVVLVYLLILGAEALRKRLQSGLPLATISLAVALVVGFVLKFGYKLIDTTHYGF